MFHIGGFFGPLSILHDKMTYVFNHGADLKDDCQLLYQEIDAFKPFYVMFGSHHLVMMSKEGPKDKSLDLTSVNFAMPMGSTVPFNLLQDLKSNAGLTGLLGIPHMYGMTELPGIFVALTLNPKYGLGSIGPHIAIKIIDPETEEVCGPNQVGEIRIKTPLAMKGYLNRPEENEKFFSNQGWVRTGDLGSFNQLGILSFEGRSKELIKYKNQHIYPLEIEEEIRKRLPDQVLDVAVFGRPEPSVQELITALVVKKSNLNLSEQEVKDCVADALNDAKQLRGGVRFVHELPKNPQGKLLRRKLAEFYAKTV